MNERTTAAVVVVMVVPILRIEIGILDFDLI
jgi:hypothetical protein